MSFLRAAISFVLLRKRRSNHTIERLKSCTKHILKTARIDRALKERTTVVTLYATGNKETRKLRRGNKRAGTDGTDKWPAIGCKAICPMI